LEIVAVRSMSRVAVLLRAINVAGHGRLQMAELRDVLAGLGLGSVSTYLQSGNAIVEDEGAAPETVEHTIAEALSQVVERPVDALVRSLSDLDALVAGNPFVASQPRSALHATFLKVAPEVDLVSVLEAPTGVTDGFAPGERAIYVCCPDGYGNTKLTNAFFERRLKVSASTRNWNTVLNLRALLGGVPVD
jgi:uncharacterized protein (DUF1697 family)